MAKKKPQAQPTRPPPFRWTYAYALTPPQAIDRLHPIKTLLDSEHVAARRTARTWVGSVVSEEKVTHILVVSDSPEQNREVNRRLEAKLKELKAVFSITAPMAVTDEDAPPAYPPPSGGR